MNAKALLLTGLIIGFPSQVRAQSGEAPPLGEIMVTAQRQNAPYFQAERPAIGLRREADSAVMAITITSDTRDATARRQEIHAVLLAAIERAASAGMEIVVGRFNLVKVTRENYKDLELTPAGRVDTSKVEVGVKGRLGGTADATQQRLAKFVAALTRSGRATVETPGKIALTVIDPDQYRGQIMALVASDAKRSAAVFGPEFTFNVAGIDLPVMWSQISTTEVFLFLPYRYTINPRGIGAVQ